MKWSLLLFVLLTALLFSCAPKQSNDHPSSDSTTVSNDAAADSISMAQEAAQANDEPEDDKNDEPSEGIDHSRDGVASNISQYKFLGFSDDLKFAAFTVGWRAESGPDVSARLYVVDVDKNQFMGKPISAEASDTEIDAAVGLVMEKGASLLARYNISATNTGTSQYVDEQSNVNIPFDTKIFKLKLIEKSGPDANKFFELQVLTDGDPIVLQSDTSVPKSRGQVVSYKVVALFVLEDKVAVFVEYTSPDMKDYENQPYYTSRQLIVTGSLIPKVD